MAGFQMQMVIRGVLVYDLTNDAIITGIVGMGFAPSLLLVSLFGGVISDRMDRKLIIQIAQASNALLAGVVCILIFTGYIHWSHLFFVSLLQGAGFAMQLPARQAAIPDLVGRDNITNAVALNAMAMSFTTLAAPGIGGILYEWIKPEGAYLFVMLLMCASVISTSKVKPLKPPSTDKTVSVMKNIGEGLRYIYSTQLVRIVIINMIFVAILSMPFRMLVQVYAKDVYGSDPSNVGYLLAAAGIGGLFGSLAIATLRKQNNRGIIFMLSGIISAAALLLVSGLPFYYVGLISMVLIGLGESGRWALGQGLMMEISDDKYKARVMSVIMMSYGFMPLGILPLGFAIDQIGPQMSVAIFGTILMIFSICYLFLAKPLREFK
ncbi:MFS transporter [Dehalococcoidia bacterium]|nr:MFS transporter [Dehalococcoidia bacterium]